MGFEDLSADHIRATIEQIEHRIKDRFPESGLARICHALSEIAGDAAQTRAWIGRPIYSFRVAVAAILVVLAVTLAATLSQVPLRPGALSVADLIQATEAGLNEIVLLGAGIVFLVTMEARAKRRRVTKAMNRLRSLAHIIDAHQLTKDPDGVASVSQDTHHSPKRTLSAFELGRYLDYCSEMLSLIGKLGFLYVQHFHDPVANSVANDLEALTTDLSRKIWQKIIILRAGRPLSPDTAR